MLRLVRVEHSQKLMSRQLWHLALADLGVCCFILLTDGMSFVGRALQEQTYLGGTCKFITSLQLACFSASSAVEVHLAMSLLATVFRSSFGVRVLGQLLYVPWLVGLVLGALGSYVDEMQFYPHVGCKRDRANAVFIAVSVLSFVMCTLSYFACLVFLHRRQCVGYTVEHRVWTRANFYLLAWLICTLPDTVRTMVPTGGPNLLEDNLILHAVCIVLFNLNGTANTLIYMVQTGYMRRIGFRARSHPVSREFARRSPSVRDIGSFSVAVGDASMRSPSPSEILEASRATYPLAELQ